MAGVATFGEVMARFEPGGYKRLSQVMPGSVEVTFAGAEANVAVDLVSLGDTVRFITVLPNNPLSNACEAELRGLGVDCSGVVRSDAGRLGLYFLEHGANQRGSSVLYDREHSSIALLPPNNYAWDSLLSDNDWLHVTGITPAISRAAASATIEAVNTAKERGMTVSVDLNFRSKLWRWHEDLSPRELARETMTPILEYADVLFANEGDASDVFGITGGTSDVERGYLDTGAYRAVATELTSRFPNLSTIGITLRESVSASFNRWGALLYDVQQDRAIFAPRDGSENLAPYEIRDIVDRLGAGDSFAAGIIYGLRDPDISADLADVADFAVAASALCHSIHGDFNRVSKQEVAALAGGIESGRVRR